MIKNKKRNPVIYFVIIFSIALVAIFDIAFAQEAKKIYSIEAYDLLNTFPDTYLIDIRTRAEYQFVGHPYNAYLIPYMVLSHPHTPMTALGLMNNHTLHHSITHYLEHLK